MGTRSIRLAAGVTTTAAAISLALASTAPARPVPSPIYGVTYDNVARIQQIVDASSNLARMPTSRIVFDEGVNPAYYANPVSQLRPVSYVMGELLDSSAVRRTSVAGYRTRTTRYLDTLGANVDIWEIGNEVNGEWLGTTSSVVAKMSNAYDQTTARGYPTAVTLYYNPDCWSKRGNEMFRWTDANMPARMRAGLDYVFVAYYEQDCNDHRPTLAEWQVVFDRLRARFPDSKLGFGEVGTRPRSSLAYKTDTLQRYYGMPVTTPGYVHGHFWWYGYQDFLPWTRKPLWQVLNAEVQTY